MAHSDERTLASMLAAMDEAALATVLHRRGVSASVGWEDCFDAAEALLAPAEIEHALTSLSRDRLRMVVDASARPQTAGDADEALAEWALVAPDGHPFAAVAAVTTALEPEVYADDGATRSLPPRADPDACAPMAERAWSTVAAITDLVGLDAPITTTGTGAVTAADRRRLIAAEIAQGPTELDDLIALAHAAGLVRRVDRDWRLTHTGAHWLGLPALTRWGALATGWRDRLPEAVRTDAGGYLDPRTWAGRMPLADHWPQTATRWRRRGVLLGLYDQAGAEPAWAQPLRTGGRADPEPLAALLPGEIDRVYLQADLTAIAPGPLRGDLDLRLRTMAVRESRAQAAGYRFTADSISSAFSAGEDAASLRAFLGALSLTGIPQPLEYLITQAETRFGRVRVGVDTATGRTRVSGPDAAVLQTIAVDQALRPLGLVEEDAGTLLSRVERDAVFWALRDAHYPVVAVDERGRIQPLRRRTPVVDDEQEPFPPHDLLETAARLIADSAVGSDGAWLARELDRAVRDRRELEVTVRMPDQSQRVFTLEATGIGGGRLRGRDRTADIERTLPLSHIVAVSAH